MAETSHLLEPGGWRMTYRESKNKVCTELLPEPGTTILIGQPRTGKGCSAVWVDRKGKLQTISILPVDDHWEAKVKYDGKNYVITVDVRPGTNGKPAIGGMVKPANSKTAPILRPGGGLEAQGTWGAEANPGGGKG
jgi:hypothetical protein